MEEKKTVRIRRVGTFTFGLILIVLGLLLILHMAFPGLDYIMIFRLWPFIFIILGIEILHSCSKPEEQIKYDGAAIFLMIVLVCFTIGMGFMDWMFEHYRYMI